ncbi:MAG: hypothetical protein FD177_2706 [Desulfovibrionaceae bacterium]|nr:MAG: hypothetical protein FD177_2706 [Desulfovibrionaceae bacterium]
MLKSMITIRGNSIGLGYPKPLADRNTTSSAPRTRGVIKGMSRRALNNLMYRINSLPAMPTRFVVLNFHPDVPVDPLSVRNTIKLLGQRLVRRFTDSFTLWRLEFTKRGVPHIHTMGDFGFIPEPILTDWLFRAWSEIHGLDVTEPNNLVFVRIALDPETHKAVRYFCKFKKEDERGAWIYCEQYGHTGRCSGIFNRAKANLAPVEWRFASEVQRKEIEDLLVDSLEQRLVDINPGVNVPARQAFIDKVASGKDTCLHFQSPELIDKVRSILGDAA